MRRRTPNGLDRPLDEQDPAIAEAKPFGVRTIEEVLGYAMAHRHPAAAAAAARLLGEIGKADEVLYQGDRPAPLGPGGARPRPPAADGRAGGDRAIEAFQAVRRLELRAVGVGLLRGQQRRPPCAGRRPEPRRDARPGRACWRRPASRPTRPPPARNCFCLATRSPDYELAWIDVSIDHPEIGTLLQELRRDPRTALLRVGLLARAGYLPQAEHLAELDPMAKAFARPHDEKACRWQLGQLATLAPEEFVDFDMRQRQAARALDLLAELSQSSGRLYDLRRVQDAVLVALHNPKTCRQGGGRVGQFELGREPTGAGGRGQPLHLAAGAAAGRGRGLLREPGRNMASC